jgi:hypothetical protein
VLCRLLQVYQAPQSFNVAVGENGEGGEVGDAIADHTEASPDTLAVRAPAPLEPYPNGCMRVSARTCFQRPFSDAAYAPRALHAGSFFEVQDIFK